MWWQLTGPLKAPAGDAWAAEDGELDTRLAVPFVPSIDMIQSDAPKVLSTS